MVTLRVIPRTATFTWSPGASSQFIATGTRAGAIDADFSNLTQLELWDLDLNSESQCDEVQLVASIDTDSRFHDIQWANKHDGSGSGVIAGALENGSLDLWDAQILLDGKSKESHLSRTSNHNGPIRALQFNHFRPELLATAGTKGELFVSDLNNIHDPFRLGSSVGRADDYECLDWNNIVPHIMATGSNTGYVTVWDVKTKKESLTLNNLGRKAVGAIAWDPDKSTRLVTAIPHDADPLILVWDLRNANAPERVLRGHEGGVLSLSWCPHDNELLLSCGKDNRSICWNPQTGDSYGEIAVAKNWSFQTSWNSRNPNILASASFDGKIEIQSIQTTLSDDDVSSESRIKSSDDKDFFNIAQAHPLGSRFILPRAPKWMQRPCGAVFGFGGKVAKFGLARKTGVSVHSSIRILQFAVDIEVSACTEAFEELLNSGNLKSICKARSEDATENSEKSDWKTIEALTLDNPRKEIIAYLGFSSADDPGTLIIDAAEEKGSVSKYKNGSEAVKKDPLSAPFDIDHDEGIFLSKLDTSQGAKISDPFRIYSGSETESEREITRALLLGQFDQALDVCLREGNLSDAFMIAICGGETCIAKVQKSYFRQKSEGPSYLRLLASVVNKNLWDFVYNADISDWKELMTVLCTYAGAEEFSDLCEALGDRLESQMKTSNKAANVRSDAAFCYLAGSKLEKVISMWISELERPYELPEVTYPSQSNFSLYARLLQGFIEKVTVFRKVINFEDGELFTSGGWKLNKLYDKYIEYANMVASCGQLHIAQRYLALVPEQYPPANFARDRVKKALRGPSIGEESGFTPNTNKFPPQVSSLKGLQDHKVVAERSVSVLQNSFPKETTVQSKYPVNQLSDGFYQQKNMNSVVYQRSHESQKQPHAYGGPAQPNLPRDGHELIPTSQNPDKSPFTLTPTQASTTSNWNDTPESFFRPPTSRRGTPGINVGSLPNSLTNPNAFDRPISGSQIRSINQLGPPPKGVGVPPARINSPSIPVSQSVQPPPKYASTISGVYMPSQSASSAEPVRQNAPLPRGASPYQSSPTSLPPSNRYAPAPLLNSAASLARPGPAMMSGTNRPGPLPPNPYVSQGTVSLQHKNGPGHDGAASSNASMAGPSSLNFEPNRGPPDLPVQPSRPGPPSVQQPNVPSLPPPKYPPGDRSHIPPQARIIYEVFNSDMQRVKAQAPQSFRPQVIDTEKRLNILFDHLNNDDLLKEDTIQDLIHLSRALQSRDYELSQSIHVELLTNKTEECGNWMVGVKRLIGMVKATT